MIWRVSPSRIFLELKSNLFICILNIQSFIFQLLEKLKKFYFLFIFSKKIALSNKISIIRFFLYAISIRTKRSSKRPFLMINDFLKYSYFLRSCEKEIEFLNLFKKVEIRNIVFNNI